MKHLLSTLIILLIATSIYAQAPEKMSYQAVIRDTSNSLVTNQSIGVRISILQGSTTGSSSYVETHSPTSNVNGMISIEIGGGTVVSGGFDTINWGNGPYFLQTEIDPAGGTTYTISGTSQLLSVPYALHAKTADSLSGGVSITELDPVFDSSLASDISSSDTAHWNNHTIDSQLDSSGVAALGYVAGEHTSQIDSSGIAGHGFVAGDHTVDTQLDSSGVAGLGYVAGDHTIDTQLDSTGVAGLGYVAGDHTVDTQLDSAGVAGLGYVAGDHTIDTQLDSAGVAGLGYVAGAHTDSTAIANMGFITSLSYSVGLNSDLGGYVFYVTPDGKHGLVAALQDQSSGVSQYAADNVCNDSTMHDANGRKFLDWRLPTRRELNMMWTQRTVIGGFTTGVYWSSTQFDFNDGWRQNFATGSQSDSHKNYQYRVRCVRVF